jgi:hypothetical protein
MTKSGTVSVNIEEQETTVQFNRSDNNAKICTSDSTMKTKLNKLCKESPKHWKLIQEDEIFSFYECEPKTLISFRSKVTERTLTDEQREAMAERLRNARSKQN